MATLDDLRNETLTDLQVLMYGKPGAGKTILAHTFPRPRTLDLDGGLRSVRWAIDHKVIPEPKGWVYETIREEKMGKHGFVTQATAFDKATDILDEWLKESGEFETIIVDSCTNLNVFALNKALQNMDKLGLSKSWAQSKSAQMQIAKMQDFGGAMTLFNHFTDWVRSLGKNVVYVAHEYEQVTDSGSLRSVQPLLIGQLRQRIVKDFDEVWYCTTKGTRDRTEYITQTKSDGIVTAKSRLGVFDAQEPFLTYQNVVRKLNLKTLERG